MQGTLLVLAVVAAGMGLRTYAHPLLRKLGALCYLGATYLAAWWWLESHWAGLLAVTAWFFLPWLEILTRVRALRLPLDRVMRTAFPPSAERFPHLSDMTGEIEDAGFEHIEDTVFEWADSQQFMRLFYRAEEKLQAAICLLEQGGLSMAWVSLSSRAPDGRTWTTWNYPFSHTMKLPPGTTLQTVLEAESFEHLLEAHRARLHRDGMTLDDLAAPDAEALPALIQQESRRQIDHNLDMGLIKLSGDGTFRYSWRGYFFLWKQFLRDMFRLS